MKILFVQDSLGTGGAERSNADLWYFLRSKGIVFKVAVLEHRRVGIEKEIVEAGFDVTFLKTAHFMSQASAIAEIVKSYKPDFVHATLFRSTFRCRMAKTFTKFVLVESLVNCTYAKIRFEDPKVNKFLLWFYMQLDKLTQNRTEKFIAITNEVKRHFAQHAGIPEQKIDVIYRGRSDNELLSNRTELRKEVRKELNLAPNEKIFIHVGRQEFQKGHLILLKALKQVESELQGAQVTFVMCGRDGNATEAIQEFLQASSLKVKVLWLGHRKDVPRLLVASDVFVFPSLYEGLGGSLIEAQAAALPVICSDLPVFEEVVNRNDNAIMFTTADEGSLARAILNLLADTALAVKMGRSSLENYERKFRLDQIHEKTLSLYKNLVQ